MQTWKVHVCLPLISNRTKLKYLSTGFIIEFACITKMCMFMCVLNPGFFGILWEHCRFVRFVHNYDNLYKRKYLTWNANIFFVLTFRDLFSLFPQFAITFAYKKLLDLHQYKKCFAEESDVIIISWVLLFCINSSINFGLCSIHLLTF